MIASVAFASFVPSSKAAAANENVQVWLTLADGSKKLLQETDLTFAAGAGSGTVINVNPNTLYQKFEGAGAAMTDSSAWLISDKLTTTQRNALMNNLFTRTGGGIGLSYIRIPMGASDFALNNYTYDDMPAGQTDPTLANFSVAYDQTYIIPTLQQALALNPSLRFMGTPWSAPAWMKSNESLNGGTLKPEYYQAFANYHVKFIQAYTAAGLPIDTITPQNEPMHQTTGYPSMGMTAAEQTIFVRDHFGPALAAAGLDTKILVLDHNWDLTNYPLTILDDADARAYVAGTAFHCYAGSVANQSIVHTAYPEKGTWFTECSGGGWATDFGDNVSWGMKNLVIGNFRNWGKSMLYWNLALNENDGPTNGGCTNCRGVVTINETTGDVTYNEEYYALGHITKFIDPGAYRAESTNYGDGQPENVAFLNPDGSLALIVHSTAASTFDVEWNGQHFSYTLPAKGTVTFKWNTGSAQGPTVTPQPTATQAPTATPYPAGPLQPFEQEGTYYTDYQAVTSLSTDVVHGGTYSMKSFSDTGEWHTVGAYLNDRPINASQMEKICLWIYDTTGLENTLALRLLDSTGASQEYWSDNPVVGTNPKTSPNTWVQMCFKLSAYSLVNLTKLDRVQVAVYWAGTYYFDDITGHNPEPTATPTATDAPTATPSSTATPTATAIPSGSLQPFEQEGTYYTEYQAITSLSTEVVHGGTYSMKSFSDTGAWHTVGAYLNGRPVNASNLERICFWVYDTTAADNSLALRIFDNTGANQEFWSDNVAVGSNSKTIQNTWVQMCFNLSAYTSINTAALDKVQIAVYWAGTYYFDDFTGHEAEATATPSATPSTTPSATATMTASATATKTATASATNTPVITPTFTPTNTPSKTPTPVRIVKTFQSIAGQDGWVRESGENTSAGGQIDAIAAQLLVGDDALNREHRSVVSFNASSIPDNAVIVSVQLRVKLAGVIGTNPFTTHGPLRLDIRRGFLNLLSGLELADFGAPAHMNNAASFNSTAVNGWFSATLPQTAFQYVNLRTTTEGLTQFRLHFNLEDNNDLGADQIKFQSGNATSDQPQLVITYYIP